MKRETVIEQAAKFGIGSVSISNLSKTITDKLVNDIEQKKEEIIINRLKELNIEWDPEIEQHRRFKLFASEIRGDEEVIYYNDGSMSGLRIITFKTTQKQFEPFNSEAFKLGCVVSYY